MAQDFWQPKKDIVDPLEDISFLPDIYLNSRIGEQVKADLTGGDALSNAVGNFLSENIPATYRPFTPGMYNASDATITSTLHEATYTKAIIASEFNKNAEDEMIDLNPDKKSELTQFRLAKEQILPLVWSEPTPIPFKITLDAGHYIIKTGLPGAKGTIKTKLPKLEVACKTDADCPKVNIGVASLSLKTVCKKAKCAWPDTTLG